MKVQDIMTKDVSFCNPETSAASAAEIMWTRNCGSLPVVGEDGRLAGIVTDRDLFIALGTNNRSARDFTVSSLLEKEICTCAPEDDIRSALRAMARQQVQRLPVVDEAGALMGILSLDDIVLRADGDGLSSEDMLTGIKAIWRRQIQRQTIEARRPATQRTAA